MLHAHITKSELANARAVNEQWQREQNEKAAARRAAANRPWNILEQDAPTVRREADARLARFLRDNPRKSN